MSEGRRETEDGRWKMEEISKVSGSSFVSFEQNSKLKTQNSKLFLAMVLLLSGCGIYSFNGASIDYVTTKTISVTNFFNDTAGGPPNMGQFFTEELRDYFQRNTKLELVQKKGDLQFEGAISDYDVRPQSVSSSGNRNQNDQTGLMRLNIGVEVTFTNTKKEAESFNRTFSFFADYDPSSTTLTAVEDDLVEEIFDQIIFDIFQAAVAQW